MFGSSRSFEATRRAVRAAEEQVVSDELRSFERRRRGNAKGSTSPRSRAASLGVQPNSSTSDASLFPIPAGATAAAPATANAAGTASAKGANSASGRRPNLQHKTQRLLRTPFANSPVHGERTVLAEAQQVEKAVTWLLECPSSTLQTLQQRVLRESEVLFNQLIGMPLMARELLVLSADPNVPRPRHSSGGAIAIATATRLPNQSLTDEGAAEPVYVTAPTPLTFRDFLSIFICDTSLLSNTVADFYGVLSSGRPQPAAPLASLHLVYGLHHVEDVLRPATALRSTRVSDASTTSGHIANSDGSGLEAHQALLSEVVHWANFFEFVFDEAREGLCRDPLNLYVAVLLACAERGAWQLRHSPAYLSEEAVRHLHLADGETAGRRPHSCVACRVEAATLADSCRSYVWRTVRASQRQQRDTAHASPPLTSKTCTAQRGTSRPKVQDRAARVRFFLATPAVVWWAAAFLRLYRLHTPTAAPTTAEGPQRRYTKHAREHSSKEAVAPTGRPRGDGVRVTPAEDELSSAEAYFLRDWIAQAAKIDVEGFVAQEATGGFVIPLSCATDSPVAVFSFTHENVEAGLRQMTEWINTAVETNAPLSVQELLQVLQDAFPVLPYYLSYFNET